MLSVREAESVSMPSATPSSALINSPSSVTWFYLSFEFLLGLGISGFLLFLSVVKRLLPKPPRDLTGDVVLVTGATSTTLGGLLVEEFARGGCSVICVDEDGGAVEEVAAKLRARFPPADDVVEDVPRRRKDSAQGLPSRPRFSGYAYSCDLRDREQIRSLAKRVKEDVGRVDVLVTCAGDPRDQLFDTVSRTLMSHYWTVLAFLPAMLHRERAHVIGITPAVSTEDAYMGSKAAVAGLMESLGQEFSGRNNRLTFMTVAPKAEPSLLKQSERDIAKEVVHAVQRDLPCLTLSWSSKLMYHISYRLYGGITTITTWLDT